MALRHRFFISALVSLLVLALTPIGRGDTATPMLVRVHPDSASEAEYILSTFDTSENNTAGSIELLLWPGDLARLDAMGADYDVVYEDLFAHDSAIGTRAPAVQRLPGPDRSDYRHLEDYNAEMKAM